MCSATLLYCLGCLLRHWRTKSKTELKMKKTLCFFAVLLMSAMAIGQSIVVTFTGRNQNGNYHPFTSVSVQNQTRGWSQTLTYPDTTLILNVTQGIADVDRQLNGLSAVAPNPFVGTATATLALADAERVSFEVVRINGQRIVAKDLDLPAGSHQIALSLVETQVAFLVVKTPTQRYVAKLANKGNGGGNDIRLLGSTENIPQRKAVAEGDFQVGDLMSYVGLSGDGGTSTAVAKSQQASELISLVFTDEDQTTGLPTVITLDVSNITAYSATCGGNVTDDGNTTVTERGVCWSTSHNPTVSGSHTTDGSGTGSFPSSITGLTANTTYYVRAYARNARGIAYGAENTFTTGVGGFDANGASNCVFSVSSTKQVRFSKGNLQYQASTGTWRFAENQTDCIGDGNTNISSSYNGWIDLFGWGTSGWNSGANAYQPWSTSTTDNHYQPGGGYSNDLTGTYANADWGVYNAISNGGNQAGMWRTLTKDEWDYLIFYRSYYSYSYVKATVNGVKGIIVFPDNFTVPSGVVVTGYNTTSIESTANVYSQVSWTTLQNAGCIFLPFAGTRWGTDVLDGQVSFGGSYWSSTHSNESPYYCQAWAFSFGDINVDYGTDHSSVEMDGAMRKCGGYSVRLVQDAN